MAVKRDQVAAALRAAITTGSLAPGDKLPTEPELAKTHGIGTSTVRAAVAMLVSEGYIRTEHGRGSFVLAREPLERYATQRLSKPAREASQASSVSTRIYIEFADEDTALELGGIGAGAEVLVRDRVMGIGGQPTQLSTSRYPRTLTKDTQIEQKDTGPGGVLARFEDAGHTIAGHTERVCVHRLTEKEAGALQLPTGAPTLRIVRTTTSDTGRALEVNTITLVDRYELIYDVPAE